MISRQAQELYQIFPLLTECEEEPFDLETERLGAEAAGSRTGEPPSVEIQTLNLGGLRTLEIKPKLRSHSCCRAILLLHGGAYAMMSPESHARFACHVAHAACAVVYLPAYSLAPENPFPAALEECTALLGEPVFRSGKFEQFVLLGESAGGGLAAAVLVKAREVGLAMPDHVVLLCPWLDLSLSGESVYKNKHAARILRRSKLEILAQLYCGNTDPKNPLVSPLFADLHGLPPVYIQAAELDLIVSDSIRFASAAAKQGVDVRLDVFPEMHHSFQFFAGVIPEADSAIQRVASWLSGSLT